MTDRISFPLRPMVGVIGCATGGETLTNGYAGEHGGNLDNHLHGPGATVYLPVRQPGGMLAIGDMHASMGDGEICFTGVEISGEVTIRVSLLKGKQGTWPVTELADRWVVHGTAGPDFMEALDRASEEARPLPRRPVGLHDGGGVHLPLGRLRREHLPGLPAAAVLDDRARFDPEDRSLPEAFQRAIDVLRPFYADVTARCSAARIVCSTTSIAPLGGTRT